MTAAHVLVYIGLAWMALSVIAAFGFARALRLNDRPQRRKPMPQFDGHPDDWTEAEWTQYMVWALSPGRIPLYDQEEES